MPEKTARGYAESIIWGNHKTDAITAIVQEAMDDRYRAGVEAALEAIDDQAFISDAKARLRTLIRALAGGREGESKKKEIAFCDVCPHALYVHNKDGTCPCGTDCPGRREKRKKVPGPPSPPRPRHMREWPKEALDE